MSQNEAGVVPGRTTIKKFSIFNFQFSISQGFTLIEMLVVLVVVVVVGGIVTAILFTALRGTTKTNILTNVRQNGNFAILQMSKTIRTARRFGGMSNDDTTFVTDCPAASYAYVRVTPFDGGDITFQCTATNILSNSSQLLDENAVQLVGGSCAFTCSRSSSSSVPTIGVRFSLTQRVASVLAERTATPITFQTSVTIRNIAR